MPRGIIPSLDISNLPSGNYNLVVAAHNKDNQTLLYQKTSFFRSNPSVKATDEVSPYSTTFAALINDEEELNGYLKALYPIATAQEAHVESIRNHDLAGGLAVVERHIANQENAVLLRLRQEEADKKPSSEESC